MAYSCPFNVKMLLLLFERIKQNIKLFQATEAQKKKKKFLLIVSKVSKVKKVYRQ